MSSVHLDQEVVEGLRRLELSLLQVAREDEAIFGLRDLAV
jgi:hypothetical protein